MYARSLQDTRSHGGDERHCHHAYDTCIVVDICQWTEDMTVCTKHRFPDTELRIVHSSASLTGFGVVVKLHSPSPRAVSRHHHEEQSSAKSHPGSSSSADPDECSKSTSMPRRVYQRVSVLLSLWVCRCMQIPVNAFTRVYMQRSSITGLAVCACTVYVFICIIGFVQSFDAVRA